MMPETGCCRCSPSLQAAVAVLLQAVVMLLWLVPALVLVLALVPIDWMTDYQLEGDATRLFLGLLEAKYHNLEAKHHVNSEALLNQQMGNMLTQQMVDMMLLDLVAKSSSHVLCFSLLMLIAVAVTPKTKSSLAVNATPRLNHEQDM